MWPAQHVSQQIRAGVEKFAICNATSSEEAGGGGGSNPTSFLAKFQERLHGEYSRKYFAIITCPENVGRIQKC